MNRPTIKLKGKGFNFVVPLGDGPVQPTQGGPVINELTRPGRPSLTQAENQQLVRLDVPAFWDGLEEEVDDVEPDVMQVVGLALQLPMRDFVAEGPMPFSGGRFLMDWPEWGKQWRRHKRIIQWELTLKLVEYNSPGDLKPHHRGSGGHPGSDGGVRAPAVVTLPKPMNLIEVAAIYAGDPAEAKAIGKANGIHDIKKKLPKGTKIKIPAG